MTTRLLSIFSPSWSSQNRRSSLSPNLRVTIPDTFSHYPGFEYRLWFIWYIWHRWSVGWGPPPLTIICGSGGNGNLWLWEDEDEEYIESVYFTENLSSYFSSPGLDWNDDLQGLKAHLSQATPAESVLARLAPQVRLRFIVWLLIAGPIREDRILRNQAIPSINILIYNWAESIRLPLIEETCHMCQVSGVLPVWMETMLEVYSRDDVRSLPWNHRCNCFESQLAASSGVRSGVIETPLGRNLPAFHILYGLVVPPWLLLNWVTYRSTSNRTDLLPAFLDRIRGPDLDLFAWDSDDDSCLRRRLSQAEDRIGLYPCDWNEYMVEIPIKTWVQISNTTQTKSRPRLATCWDDLDLRLTAMLLAYSSTPMTCKRIFTTLGVNFKDYGIPFDTMARAMDRDHQDGSAPASFNSQEFWTSDSLEHRLSACDETLCHSVWHAPYRIGLLEGVQVIDVIFEFLPRNLAIYTYSLMGKHDRRLSELAKLVGADNLRALQCYSKDVQFLVGLISQSVENNPSTSQTIAKHVHEHMKRDLSGVGARLVLCIRDPRSYKEFLSSRGTDAQRLLDLLQDLLDLDLFAVVRPLIFQALLQLSRASSLHPRCLALSELQKVGPQVTGGGFGDIWKGLIRGQSVCVKVMRIFEDSNVQALLKEFGREAVIWRQLCHPNVLPFFGIYYLEQRLCLIAPWMDNGHIMKFLAAKNPTNPKRLSLILDVAFGLQYLHENKVVHGDLKGLNILVTPSHRACIADFGLSAIAEAMTVQFTHTTVTARGGTARYQAPELFKVENPVPIHYGSDVYAFSCVTYEILTGKVPFHELRNDMAVMTRVAQGYRPPRPDSCSFPDLDGLWELMQKCWEEDAQTRPTASQIVEWLGSPLIGAQTASSTSDWSHEFTSKFRRSQQAEPLLPSVSQIESMLFGDVRSRLFQSKRRYQDSNDGLEGAITGRSAAKKSKLWIEMPSRRM